MDSPDSFVSVVAAAQKMEDALRLVGRPRFSSVSRVVVGRVWRRSDRVARSPLELEDDEDGRPGASGWWCDDGKVETCSHHPTDALEDPEPSSEAVS